MTMKNQQESKFSEKLSQIALYWASDRVMHDELNLVCFGQR